MPASTPRTPPAPMDDAALVAAYLNGDRSALAAIYDRYSPGLYDTAASMLRDRHEAADAMQDVFVVAAERLGQLRDPTRLKPWMYAILRNEVYRRTKKRSRALPTDFAAPGVAEMAAPTTPDADGEALIGADLAELIRGAARGLDERDHLVLELSMRQGLQGADLADALGVSPDQSYTLVHRMRERVERSLGAYAVAKAGRRDCAELNDILRGWDGEFTILIRKRVARHIDGCSTCERNRKKVAPLALFSAAPAFAAPIALRDQVLDAAWAARTTPSHTYQFDRADGFPRPPRGAGGGWLQSTGGRNIGGWMVGAAAAALIAVGAGIVLLGNDDGADVTPAAQATDVPATAEATVDATGASSPATSSTPPESTVADTVVPATPGVLSVSTASIDLGATTTSAVLDITNTGGLPVGFALNPDITPFTVDVEDGIVEPGQTARLTIAVQRPAQEGDLRSTLAINLTDRTVTVALAASVERPPVLSVIRGINDDEWCVGGDMFALLNATDESALAPTATLTWTGQGGSGTEILPSAQRDNFSGRFPAPLKPGTYDFVVSVADVRGNVGELGGTFIVNVCPG